MVDPKVQEPQSIPLAVGSDFKLDPVRANFPDQQHETKSIGEFRGDPPAPITLNEQPKSWLDSPPFTGTAHATIQIPSGVILIAIIAIAVAAVAITFLRRRK